MNIEGLDMEKKKFNNGGYRAFTDLLAMIFGLLLMYVAKDIVEAIWSFFHLPF